MIKKNVHKEAKPRWSYRVEKSSPIDYNRRNRVITERGKKGKKQEEDRKIMRSKTSYQDFLKPCKT